VFVRKFKICAQAFLKWVVTEKIHTPRTEEISAVWRGRGKKIVSDNSKCIRTSKGVGGCDVQSFYPEHKLYFHGISIPTY
jgi:hypothetical protein